MQVVVRVLAAARDGLGVRLVQWAVQRDHLHLLVEPESERRRARASGVVHSLREAAQSGLRSARRHVRRPLSRGPAAVSAAGAERSRVCPPQRASPRRGPRRATAGRARRMLVRPLLRRLGTSAHTDTGVLEHHGHTRDDMAAPHRMAAARARRSARGARSAAAIDDAPSHDPSAARRTFARSPASRPRSSPSLKLHRSGARVSAYPPPRLSHSRATPAAIPSRAATAGRPNGRHPSAVMSPSTSRLHEHLGLRPRALEAAREELRRDSALRGLVRRREYASLRDPTEQRTHVIGRAGRVEHADLARRQDDCGAPPSDTNPRAPRSSACLTVEASRCHTVGEAPCSRASASSTRSESGATSRAGPRAREVGVVQLEVPPQLLGVVAHRREVAPVRARPQPRELR